MHSKLCCTLASCAVPCCAVQVCVVRCAAVPCCAMLCWAGLAGYCLTGGQTCQRLQTVVGSFQCMLKAVRCHAVLCCVGPTDYCLIGGTGCQGCRRSRLHCIAVSCLCCAMLCWAVPAHWPLLDRWKRLPRLQMRMTSSESSPRATAPRLGSGGCGCLGARSSVLP